MSPFQDLINTVLTDEILARVFHNLRAEYSDLAACSLVCKRWRKVQGLSRRRSTVLRVEVIPKLPSWLPALTDLDLSTAFRVSDAELELLAESYGPSLQKLDLSHNKLVTETGLEALSLHCTQLQSLTLNVCDLEDGAMMAVAGCVSLKHLSLSSCRAITDIGLCCLAAGCKSLTSLNLRMCMGISDKGVSFISANCSSLKELDLGYTNVSQASMRALSRLLCLKSLNLAACPLLNDPAVAALRHGCGCLESLDVSGCESVTDVGISALTTCGLPLRHLTISRCPQISDSLLSSLFKFPLLSTLKMDSCSVSNSGLASWASAFPASTTTATITASPSSSSPSPSSSSSLHLKELSLRRCEEVADEGLVPLLSCSPALEILDATCCRGVSDASLHALAAHCSSLRSLRLEGCQLITVDGLRALTSACPLITDIDLTDTDISEEVLPLLAQCTCLRTLKLGFDPNVTDNGLMQLGQGCPKLQEIDLYRCAGFTHEGMTSLTSRCNDLRVVILSYCAGVDDRCLMAIGRCSRLLNLELRGSVRVTSSGLEAVSRGCHRLREVDLKRCWGLEGDRGFVALANGCPDLRQANLCYCPIGDAGLQALAFLNCMTKLNLVHCTRLTVAGICTALLSCGGLQKLKMLTEVKAMLPKGFVETLEDRGCKIRWMQKDAPEMWSPDYT